ncbi:MAG: cation diffusion facilitator family transporter [Gemmatimonadota bacterium]|nr:cation diffusion facilitator family transporter [Gemmatimonadota bacterium]
MTSATTRGIRSAQAGLLINVVLVVVKLIAGIVGNAYALIADAIESSTDVFSSLIVWAGLSIAARPADEDHPYGHGKAEPLAAAVVSILLLGAALGISILAIREIRTPHHAPAPFTLFVALGVMIVKEILHRRVQSVGAQVGGTALVADAWHHRSDAISSLAAFVGIGIALWGGKGWESADDWAALLAALITGVNGVRALQPAIAHLMDAAPDRRMLDRACAAARGVEGVRNIESLNLRSSGLGFFVDLHAQADATLTLEEAHVLSGMIKSAICAEIPEVVKVLVHMEPYRAP